MTAPVSLAAPEQVAAGKSMSRNSSIATVRLTVGGRPSGPSSEPLSVTAPPVGSTARTVRRAMPAGVRRTKPVARAAVPRSGTVVRTLSTTRSAA